MIKRFFVFLMLVCTVFCLLAACGEKKETVITQQEAYAIILEDLGISAEEAGSPHFHIGTHDGMVCYNFFLTVAGESWCYTISTAGEILDKGPGTHSH